MLFRLQVSSDMSMTPVHTCHAISGSDPKVSCVFLIAARATFFGSFADFSGAIESMIAFA